MPHQSAEDHVVNVLREVGEEMATGEIVDELSGAYKASTIRGAISNLRKQGRIERVKQGVYKIPSEDGGEKTLSPTRNRSNKSEHGDPIYDTPASAGNGATEFTESPVGRMPPSQSLSSTGRDVFWMPVIGDSMGEKYQKHSLVPVARFYAPASDIPADDVYVIRLEGGDTNQALATPFWATHSDHLGQ